MNRKRAALLCASVALLGVCYARTLSGMVYQWTNDEDMGHGFAVPFVMLFIAWRERKRWQTLQPEPVLSSHSDRNSRVIVMYGRAALAASPRLLTRYWKVLVISNERRPPHSSAARPAKLDHAECVPRFPQGMTLVQVRRVG